jgi:hypothetical protein
MKMNWSGSTIILSAATLFGAFAQAVDACSMEPYDAAEIFRDVQNSKSVTTGDNCSFVNGGTYSQFSGGPAINLENERFYQVLETEGGIVTDVLVVDCNESAVTRISAAYIKNKNYAEDSCGGEHGDRHTMLAPKGPLTLLEGGSLADLEKIAEASGHANVGWIKALIYDPLDKKLPRRKQVDFLCGCQKFYPESNGAKH